MGSFRRVCQWQTSSLKKHFLTIALEQTTIKYRNTGTNSKEWLFPSRPLMWILSISNVLLRNSQIRAFRCSLFKQWRSRRNTPFNHTSHSKSSLSIQHWSSWPFLEVYEKKRQAWLYKMTKSGRIAKMEWGKNRTHLDGLIESVAS